VLAVLEELEQLAHLVLTLFFLLLHLPVAAVVVVGQEQMALTVVPVVEAVEIVLEELAVLETLQA
jgi:hypothetical protein